MAHSKLQKYGPGLFGAALGFSATGVVAAVANASLEHSFKKAAFIGGFAGGGLMILALVSWFALKKKDAVLNSENSDENAESESSVANNTSEMAKDFKFSLLLVLGVAFVMMAVVAGLCVAAYYFGPPPPMYGSAY